MDNSLENLIRKYLDGSATPEEIRRVETYYNSFDKEDEYTRSLRPEDRKALEDRIFSNIERRMSPEPGLKGRQRFLSPAVYRLAAAITALLILSILYVSTRQEAVTRIETAYGEVKEHVLPDNSVVVLNGNSTIEYGAWNADEPRLITLGGEAYFSVTHTETDQKFVVRVPGQFDVEVLGTEFNVNARYRQPSVVLNSGMVRVKGILTDSTITLSPGERIALDPSRQSAVKSVVNTERYVSWKDHRLVFDNTPLAEIVSMLEEAYGYTVIVDDPMLLETTFTGTIPNNDIRILMIGLNKIGLDVTIHSNEIRIKKQ